MSRPRMTPRRVRLLREIWRITTQEGRSPTLRELCTSLDLAISTLHKHLSTAREAGWLEWEHNRPRTIRLTPEGLRVAGISRVDHWAGWLRAILTPQEIHALVAALSGLARTSGAGNPERRLQS